MQQPAWGRSREFEITTRSAGRFSLTQSTTGDLEDDEENVGDGQQLVHGRRKRKVAFMPSLSKITAGHGEHPLNGFN
jgi:mitochondrial chaperone BCS1